MNSEDNICWEYIKLLVNSWKSTWCNTAFLLENTDDFFVQHFWVSERKTKNKVLTNLFCNPGGFPDYSCLVPLETFQNTVWEVLKKFERYCLKKCWWYLSLGIFWRICMKSLCTLSITGQNFPKPLNGPYSAKKLHQHAFWAQFFALWMKKKGGGRPFIT